MCKEYKIVIFEGKKPKTATLQSITIDNISNFWRFGKHDIHKLSIDNNNRLGRFHSDYFKRYIHFIWREV